jgi:predicted nucleotidyltransferase
MEKEIQKLNQRYTDKVKQEEKNAPNWVLAVKYS